MGGGDDGNFKIFDKHLKVADMNIFENDHEVLQIGSLTFENQYDSVIIVGDVQIGHDDDGRKKAQALYEFAKNLLESMDKPKQDLPPMQAQGLVSNPFDD